MGLELAEATLARSRYAASSARARLNWANLSNLPGMREKRAGTHLDRFSPAWRKSPVLCWRGYERAGGRGGRR